MQKTKKIISIIMAICLVFTAAAAVNALPEAEGFSWVYTQKGNSGAVITARENCTVVSASVDDTSLATVEINGNDITVTGVEGAVGTATVSVNYGGTEDAKIEVPIGYTTFIFDKDTLTVYDGSDTGHSVAGVNSAAEEYTDIAVETREDGGVVYSNTDTYKLYVEIPKTGGTFAFSGEGNDMAIAVKKEATAPATLLFASLDLSSSFTAPITVKKNSESTVDIKALCGHTNTFADADFNNADTYGDTADGGDGTNVEYAESAVIKGKAYADVTLSGDGTFNLVCSTKNAVKVNDYGTLTIDGPTVNITSAKHGLSSDNILNINSGFLNVDAAEDGIRTDPSAVDATLGCTGNINISGGTIVVKSGYDCIQSAQDITISGGIFNLTAGSGYSDTTFDSTTMSCKGIKASFSTDETSDTASTDATNTITVTDGVFNINTPDDAVHSDAYVSVIAGTFNIMTADDGVHADTTLGLGEEGSEDGELVINVNTCYEGLEAGTVEIYSGTYKVEATDDGINAAGDTTSEFNPGGGWGGAVGGTRPGQSTGTAGTTTAASSYSITISGGDVYVNADGDGIDSNGTLTMTGGDIVVWGMASGGENPPLDCDSTLTINGATVFASGSSQMAVTPTGQNYVRSTGSISAGMTVKVMNSSETVYSAVTPKNVNYVLYSSPDMTSTGSWSITSDSSTVDADAESTICSAGHTWDRAVVTEDVNCETNGTVTYICTVCGEAKTEVYTTQGHAYSAQYTVDTEATETAEGSMSRHCLCCDSVTDVTAIPATGTDTGTDTDTDTSTDIMVGDLDGDGQINGIDSNTLMRIVAGITAVDAGTEDFVRADINGDGSINAIDTNMLKRILAGS